MRQTTQTRESWSFKNEGILTKRVNFETLEKWNFKIAEQTLANVEF